MLFSHAELPEYISGVILYEETVDQAERNGQLFAQFLAARDIIPGVKLDQGQVRRPGFRSTQKITRGLDGLEERIRRLVDRSDGTIGFGKWRQVVHIGHDLPEWELIESALDDMAQYAAICQAEGIVPITEPEVLMDGGHSIDECAKVTGRTLEILYNRLKHHRVTIENTILKPNMVISGEERRDGAGRHTDAAEEIARHTLDVIQKYVPGNVPGIVFLSGGQTPEQATRNLEAIAAEGKKRGVNKWISFSFGRALQDAAMKTWKGDDTNKKAAQIALLNAARANANAVR